MEGAFRVDDTPVHQALREALANCLVNADYYGRRGVVIIKKKDSITLSNPGNSRIELDTAVSGGVSDPRNSTMLKMFNFIDIGERAGSGIPNIFRVWKEQGWKEPEITESYEPDRVTLALSFELQKTDGKKPTAKTDGKKPTAKGVKQRQIIIEYLTDHPEVSVRELEGLLNVKATRIKEILYGMIKEEIVEGVGEDKKRVYRLKR